MTHSSLTYIESKTIDFKLLNRLHERIMSNPNSLECSDLSVSLVCNFLRRVSTYPEHSSTPLEQDPTFVPILGWLKESSSKLLNSKESPLSENTLADLTILGLFQPESALLSSYYYSKIYDLHMNSLENEGDSTAKHHIVLSKPL